MESKERKVCLLVFYLACYIYISTRVVRVQNINDVLSFRFVHIPAAEHERLVYQYLTRTYLNGLTAIGLTL